MQRRIEVLDNIKAIAIILVSLGHILGNAIGYDNKDYLMLFCFAIELPAFFMIAGIQHKLKDRTINIMYVKKRFMRLLYPYLMFSLIYIAKDLLEACIRCIKLSTFSLSVIKWDMVDFFTTWGIGPLWFLPTLFLSDILFVIIKNSKKRNILFLCVFIVGLALGSYYSQYFHQFLDHSASISYFFGDYIARVFVACTFIYIGYCMWPLLCSYKFTKLINSQFFGACLLTGGGFLSMFNDAIVDLHFGYCRNPIITYIAACTMFLGLYCILKPVHSKHLCWLGKNSLIIMGLQFGTNYISRLAIKICSIFNMNFYIISIVGLVLFLVFAFAATEVINRHLKWIVSFPKEVRD